MKQKHSVFDCQMCGHCCEGEGGIVLGTHDLERLCMGLGMTQDAFLAAYGVKRNGKWQVKTGTDGRCIFFRTGQGCAVHEDKPDVCRAWPFFHGNMVDAESLFLAKDFCPGIRPDASHEAFVEEGQTYLVEHKLLATDPASGCALRPADHQSGSTRSKTSTDTGDTESA